MEGEKRSIVLASRLFCLFVYFLLFPSLLCLLLALSSFGPVSHGFRGRDGIKPKTVRASLYSILSSACIIFCQRLPAPVVMLTTYIYDICYDDNLICTRKTNREKKPETWIVNSVNLQSDVYMLTGTMDSSSRNNKGTNAVLLDCNPISL